MMKGFEGTLVVSVLVVTYNSSKYIIETLDSIKNQTYPYLSLIISDDCSTDKTVKLCKEWVNKNKNRFVETSIIVSSVNTGISANANRGEKSCKTKWVKEIAGDDILMPNCIQENIDYVQTHSDVIFLFSKVKVFGASEKKNYEVENKFDYDFFSKDIEQQRDQLIFTGNCIPAASLFFDIELTRSLHIINDERIPMLEDIPKWINAVKRGIHLHFMEKETVLYRIHNDSLSTSDITSPLFYRSYKLFYYYYLRDEYIKKFGEERVLQNEVNEYVNLYSQSVRYKSLFIFRLYFFVCRKIKSISSFCLKK